MIKVLFPFKLQLQIFQLDEYNVKHFLQWISNHFFVRTLENKKELVLTQKAKLILYLSVVLALVVFELLILIFGFVGSIIGILLATQPYIYLIFAYYLLLPIELNKKNKIKNATAQKLKNFPNLKIIGITGSYGKTSTKEFLFQILKTKHRVLKTPGSYNTPLGISKVVDLELDSSYEYFVCEMGAYKIGDIKDICDIVHPQFGILTGINEQHLETFGSLENTTKGKFELIDSLPSDGFGVVNIDNERIRDQIQYTKYQIPITTYGFSDELFSIKKIKQTPDGSKFLLILDGKPYDGQTKLLGLPNLQNILAAATMSYLLGMDPKGIVDAIAKLEPVPHRLEIKEFAEMTIIDDAYNSNVDGFKDAAELLKSFNGRPTVFATPGIVGLGDKTIETHMELAKNLDGIDYVFLIKESDRTKGLKQGISENVKTYEVPTIKAFWEKLGELNLEKPVVLLENDLPDNY